MLKILMWCGIASMVWVVFSCEEFCEESNRTAVVVGFYSLSNDVPEEANIEVKGIENDSLLYQQARRRQVLLPVNPVADVMSFSFKNDALLADTIVIRYIRHTGLVSPKCGCVTHAEIVEDPESTGNSISRVVVVKRKATTVSYRDRDFNAENIRIYY